MASELTPLASRAAARRPLPIAAEPGVMSVLTSPACEARAAALATQSPEAAEVWVEA